MREFGLLFCGLTCLTWLGILIGYAIAGDLTSGLSPTTYRALLAFYSGVAFVLFFCSASS